MKPITREEMYLAAAAGYDVTPPEPVTRKEKFLAKLAGMEVDTPAVFTRQERLLDEAASRAPSVTINNQDITVTENGQYTADEGYTGLGTVTVEVPDEPAVLEDLEVTENGNYTPSDGVDGFGSVTVNVPDAPAVVQPLEITENGTYTAPDGVDGYSPVVVNVTTASPDVRYVTFMSYDGLVEYGKKAVAVGDDCADPIARGVFDTPTKESDDAYDYRFDSWATEPNGDSNADWNKAITENKTVYATFIHCGGTCGSSTRWSLSEDNKTLTIYGEGAVKHFYNTGSAPWYFAAPFIETINVQSGVTGIGTYAFMDCAKLTSISFPDSVTTINGGSLMNCISLTSFTVPSGVTVVSADLLANCSMLTSITLHSSVTEIQHRAFKNCSKLKSITIPEGVVRINDAFSGTGLTSAKFVVTTGWKKNVLLGSATDVAQSTLSNTSSAANLLKTLNGYYLAR